MRNQRLELTHLPSIFCHNRDTPDRACLVPGSKVSFVFEQDEKGGKAREVLIEEAVVEDQSVRETGVIKVSYFTDVSSA